MRQLRNIFLISALLPLTGAAGDAKSDHALKSSTASYNIPLWPDGQVPLAKGDGPLDNPFIPVFLPPAGKANGTSMVVAPGGSNIMLMYGGEGMEIAERLNDWGITAFVLTYRLSPHY